MSFFTVLETLFLGPLKLIFELIFQLANEFVNFPGLSIILLSLMMNIMVLPLYRRADAMQEEARNIDMKLRDGVSHIKKTFTGNEKMMIQQTYYRQNNYKPTDALKGSVSLLLEIPFFMAAYQFLSNLEILQGASLGPIKDLAAPDGLLTLGSLTVNILPILMTVINVVSCVIYLKGFPLKSKIQLYGMAIFFLIFLYTSPSGLVFYWTLNNLFSLIKTIFYKLKNPQLILRYLTLIVGGVFVIFGAFFYDSPSAAKKIFLVAVGIALMIPMFWPIIRTKLPAKEKVAVLPPKRGTFFLTGLFLTILVGLLIPSTFIADSPQEYVDISYFHNPLWYVLSSFCMAAGFFLVWMRVFYWLANTRGKVIFCRLMWILCGVTTINYMFFGTKLGVISPALQYETGVEFSIAETLVNVGVMIAVVALFYFCIVKWQKSISVVLMTAIAAFGIMSTVNLFTIKDDVDAISVKQTDTVPNFNLSTEGQNVVVIMLDRAMGLYAPYIFNEKPELKEQFDGFTYYSNVVSFAGNTNHGAPALFGGYEYTPVEMNKRDDEPLVKKHNEALMVMPVIFSESGYDATVLDPVYANYKWISDTSIFDEYPDINAFVTEGSFTEVAPKERAISNNHRNFFCFSFMKTMPVLLQPLLYSEGTYNQIPTAFQENVYTVQTIEDGSNSVASGLSKAFMDPYNVLSNLTNITKITDKKSNTFVSFANNTTHEPMLLQEPKYTPSPYVDNTEFDNKNTERFTLNGVTIKMDNAVQLSHYQSNMAAMLQLGKWLDYLKENDVYDNTRIIIASDHGRALYHTDELLVTYKDVTQFFPLLLVKDFNSSGFSTCDDFMTNADVPTLAFEGLIENPTNPFTGKKINNDEKTAHDQYISLSILWDTNSNNGNTFLPSGWAKVSDNMWDKSNWSLHFQEAVLKEHSFPKK